MAMDNASMVARLRRAGVWFGPGVTDAEFDRIEAFFSVRFPAELRSFFACALPIGDCFFNWRDLSADNKARFDSFYRDMEQSFRFDLEHNDLARMLGEPFTSIPDLDELHRAVMEEVRHSVRLVPFYAHRCFFSGMDDMPIISFWQPVDSIFYGADLEDYLENEFLNKPDREDISPERMSGTGIWAKLIE